MERFGRILKVTYLLFISNGLFFGTVGASIHQHTENFSSKQYCDTLHTTAWWDTSGGQLKLYPFELSFAGSCSTSAFAHAVCLSGDYAYVADGESGLQVINVSDPTHPFPSGSHDTPRLCYGVFISGDYAYLADYDSGLQIVDMSDPSAPVFAGSFDTPEYAFGVAVSGNYAYVADRGSGLQVINIADPSNPDSGGSCDTPGLANDVVVSGDRAYVADGSSGLQVVDISNPAVPALAGSYDTPGLALGVAVSGDYAYVADYSSGLQVLDVSNPSAPVFAGECSTSDLAFGVVVSGDYAYVAVRTHGLQVFDISDPPNPVAVGSHDTPDWARGVATSGRYAYVADFGGGLQVIRIADPVLPPLFAGSCLTPDFSRAVAISGDRAYVADSGAGLVVVDIGNPRDPVLMGSHYTPGEAHHVVVSGDYAYVADGSYGLQVIDISNPALPDSAGNCDTPGSAHGVALSGDHAYVADWLSGLQVIDISDPLSPDCVGSCSMPGEAYGVVISGDYAYVADGLSGLRVIDISDPHSPWIAGIYEAPDEVYDVAISGDRAYLAEDWYGLQVMDISDPASPIAIARYDTPDEARAVTVVGDYAYVADANSGVHVIDISDPSNPDSAGSCDTPDWAADIAVSGDYAFVADRYGGLQVIQVFQRGWSTEENVGRSLVLNSLAERIVRAKMVTVQSDSVYWHVSADSGVNWQDFPLDTSWQCFDRPGGGLLWESKHVYDAEKGENPACDSLRLEWLYDSAIVDSIVDVPGDEGGWVLLHFTRSGLDFTDEEISPITYYYIFRRVEEGSPVPTPPERQPSGARRIPSGEFPPGTWEMVDSVGAQQAQQYVRVVPTLADSSFSFVYSAYCILAKTSVPSIQYYSPVDSGYSVDNLSPCRPEGVTGDYSYPPPELLITWRHNCEFDLSHYAVYKGHEEGFVPADSNRIGEPADSFFVDGDFDPNIENHFKLSALDIHGNESKFSLLPAGDITDVPNPPPAPQVTGLEQNAPNPFNPVTRIRFSIAQPGRVVLTVFDVAGRPVRDLVKGWREVGRYEVTWDGLNGAGNEVASGVYLCRLEAPGHTETKKVVLLK